MIYRLGDPLGADGTQRYGLKTEGLARALALGLRVPPGFALGAELFAHYREHGGLPPDLGADLEVGLAHLSGASALGQSGEPLLLSVRSSPSTSMPGMLETLLDVGATPALAARLDARYGAGVGADTRRRFLEGWARVVVGIPAERVFRDAPRVAATSAARRRTPEEIATRVAWLERELGDERPPDDLREQLARAIEAVLRSWSSPRARDYRSAHALPEEGNLAILVEAMVLGNTGQRSGAGVAYSRNPVTGEGKIFGEFACDAQGDDVVGGRVSPAGLARATSGPREAESLEARCPAAYDELRAVMEQLEGELGDAQDVEFTVHEGTLFILQVRTAKRSVLAAARIVVDLVRAGRLSRREALARLDPAALRTQVNARLPAPEVLAVDGVHAAARGVAASPGAASGEAVFSVEQALACAAAGRSCVLIRPDCTPEDAPGIRAASAVVTTSGGLTAHAAVIARALGRPCIVSASPMRVSGGQAQVRGEPLAAGDPVTVDGSRGLFYTASVPAERHPVTPEVGEVLSWGAELGLEGW